MNSILISIDSLILPFFLTLGLVLTCISIIKFIFNQDYKKYLIPGLGTILATAIILGLLNLIAVPGSPFGGQNIDERIPDPPENF